MDTDIFYRYLQTVLVPETKDIRKPNTPLIVILDGAPVHNYTPEVAELCRKEHIEMVYIPAHSSHKLQPLDVSIMKPFKAALNKSYDTWRALYPKVDIDPKALALLVLAPNAKWHGEDRFCPIVKATTPENIKSGFRSTGIYPYNPGKGFEKFNMSLEDAVNGAEVECEVDEDEEDEEAVEGIQVFPKHISATAILTAIRLEEKFGKGAVAAFDKENEETVAVEDFMSADAMAEVLYVRTAEDIKRVKAKNAREVKKEKEKKEKAQKSQNRRLTGGLLLAGTKTTARAARAEARKRGRPPGSKNKKKAVGNRK